MPRSVFAALPVFLLLAGLALPVRAAEPSRRVVFMIDRSGSMPQPHHPDGRPRATTFAQEVALARSKAAEILSDPTLLEDPDVRVSFWTFGKRNALRPHDPRTPELTPAEARERLDEFFSADPDLYDHPRTYIAHSIFQLAQRMLGKERVPLDGEIPADASLLYVFVFTDGSEDVDRGFDNRPYEDWLARQQRRLQIRWNVWTLYADPPPPVAVTPDGTGEPATPAPPPQEAVITIPPPDHVTYDVHFGVPTRAFDLDPAQPPPDHKAQLEVPRLIRLVPVLGGGVVAPGQVACPADGGEAEPVPGGTLRVQARVAWGAATPQDATSEWTVSAPPRGVEERATAADGLPVRAIERGVLRLEVTGPTLAVVPGADVPDGSYAVRFDRDSLCRELRRVYPSSTFVFPSEADGALAALGVVTVHRRARYDFGLTTAEGTTPDAPLGTLTADRFHRYDRRLRTFGLGAPDGVSADVEWSVAVSREGVALAEAADLALLGHGTKTAGSLVAPAGEAVALAVPAATTTWYEGLLGRGLDREPGTYEVTVCARPLVTAAPARDYDVFVTCPACNGGAGATAAEALCVRLALGIDPPPWSWATIVALVLAGLIALWFVIRWQTRPQFPADLVVGDLRPSADLRRAHGRGFTGKVSLFRRKPAYLVLSPGGGTLLMRDPLLRRSSASPRTIVAVRPSPNRAPRMSLWCVATANEDGTVTQVHVSDTPEPLAPTVTEPKLAGENVVHLSYESIRERPAQLEVRRQRPGQPVEIDRYEIRFQS